MDCLSPWQLSLFDAELTERIKLWPHPHGSQSFLSTVYYKFELEFFNKCKLSAMNANNAVP